MLSWPAFLPSCACSGERQKYIPVTRGPFPAIVGAPTGAAGRVSAWIGSGASAYRPILVSQELAQSLTAHAVKGLNDSGLNLVSDG